MGVIWGVGCDVFLTFYAISNISRTINLGIQNNYFSFNVFFVFFFVCWKYWKVPLHLQLLVKWEVVSPNSRSREFYHEIGNIEKFPFTYWPPLLVKWGRWFLQIVDIHVGNFNMKLTGRWFPQILDGDSGNLYPIYIYNTNCGVSYWTCSREISGDRVALFFLLYIILFLLYDVFLSWNFGTLGFYIQVPQYPQNK